jgi:hypothetical protein
METVILRAEDFRTIHNALCELRSISDHCSDRTAAQINPIIQRFEAGLRDAYEQDRTQFDSKMDYYSEFQKDNGLRSIWSIYELPIHGFLGDHPFKNAVQVAYREHWGDEPVFESIDGPTWADLYRAADRCIQRSGDQHHIFIESFEPVAGQPHQLRLSTGS